MALFRAKKNRKKKKKIVLPKGYMYMEKGHFFD